ncbi:succinate dehydrogenase, hydrophobic membrane anchor protein [Marinicellulosiphila megalodicopiae]|uniref:succinate dehydrogenase, hydrophobic membrane anchor protein n=1 Tax=Marinicellulosiphila megalodicopiae TaxID=2724896 RepID=UPI003BB0632E
MRVRHSTNLTRNGLTDWIVQRVSAVILAAYTLFIMAFFMCSVDVTYASWTGLFSNLWVKVFTLLTVFSIVAHAWIGMWTVFTDYVKSTAVRAFLQIGLFVILFFYFFTAVLAVWAV